MTQPADNKNILNYVGDDGEFRVPIGKYLDDPSLEPNKQNLASSKDNHPKINIQWTDLIRIALAIYLPSLICYGLAVDIQGEILGGLIGVHFMLMFLAVYIHLRTNRIDDHLDTKSKKSGHTKPWQRLTGDEHKYLSQFEDKIGPDRTLRRPHPPSRTRISTKPWRRLTGDEHRYISRFEDRTKPIDLEYPPRPTRQRLTGDEHRYISRFEDDYPKFNSARRRRNK